MGLDIWKYRLEVGMKTIFETENCMVDNKELRRNEADAPFCLTYLFLSLSRYQIVKDTGL